MRRTFVDRLAALERIEVAADVERQPPTEDDYCMIVFQCGISNIGLDEAGRPVRLWDLQGADYTAAYDVALSRLGFLLATLDDPPRTVEALEQWVYARVGLEWQPRSQWGRVHAQHTA